MTLDMIGGEIRLKLDKDEITFDEALELFNHHGLGLHLNLERHENGEEELVLLVHTSSSVRKRQVSKIVDDVLDSLRSERRLGRVGHRDVEQLEELTQRSLVHLVHHAHLYDQEVQHRPSSCHWQRTTVNMIKFGTFNMTRSYLTLSSN